MVLRVACAGLCQHNCIDASKGRVPKEDSDRSVFIARPAAHRPKHSPRQQNVNLDYGHASKTNTSETHLTKPILSLNLNLSERDRVSMKQHSKQSHPALKRVDCMIHHDTSCRLAKCLVNSLCEALSLWRPTNCLPPSLLHRRPR